MSIAIQVSFVTFISADNGISMGTGKAISIVVCGVICAGIWLQFQEFQLLPLKQQQFTFDQGTEHKKFRFLLPFII